VRRLSAPVRAAIASLVGVLAVTGLSGVADPAAAYTGHALPGVTLERPDPLGSGGSRTSPDFGVRAEVTKATALFEVDLIFPLEGAGLDCTVPANRNAEFRWELATVSGAASPADVISVQTLCTSPDDGVLQQIEVSNSVRPFDPDGVVNVMAEVEKAGTSLLAENDPDPAKSIPKLNQDEHWVGQIQMPHAPIWVGVGDGYTSSAYQQDDCAFGTSAADCATAVNGEGFTLDIDFFSWIITATDQINAGLGQWSVTPRIVATIGTKGADLRDSSDGSQVQRLVDALAETKGHGIQPDTWNWVGLSAGLGDAGISDILDGWYGSAPERGTPGSTYPWEVGAGADCPSFAGVPAEITGAARTPLQDGILNALASAFSVSDNLRVVQLLYPYFVDEASACRSEVVAAVDALNGVIGTAGLNARLDELGQPLPLQAADLSRVTDLDLNEVFATTHPTGDPVGLGDNEPSYIQLTKPFGYPHLSGDGSQKVGEKAGVIIAEPGPPVVTPRIEAVDPTKGIGDGFFRGPVRITYSVADPADPAAIFDIPPTVLTDEGRYTGLKTPAGVCSAVPPNKCADQVDIEDIKIDSLAPAVAVQYFDATGQTPVTPSAGAWFKDDVTVEWFGLNDHESDALLGAVSGYDDPLRRPSPIARPRTRIASEGANLVATAPEPVCDFAGNCATVPTSVNIDKHAPTITGTVPGLPASGWFNPTNWPTDAHAAWTANDPKPTPATVVSGVDPGTYVDTALAPVEGVQTVTKTVTDRAGNVSVPATVTVGYDSIAPTATLVDASDPANPVPVADGDHLDREDVSFACAAADPGEDEGTGSGVASCTFSRQEVGTVDGVTTWTYTLVATDVAGNVTTTSLDVLLPARAVVNTPPETAVETGPPAITNASSATFTFSGTDEQDAPGDLTYECSLDGGAFVPCAATATFAHLSDGTHTLEVRAVDTEGLVDSEPATFTWLVDTTPPVVTVPANITVDATSAGGATVTYVTTSDDGSGSGIATSSCSPGSGTFALGTTTVTCVVTDNAGNTTTRTFTVTVRNTAPDTTILTKPPAITNSTTGPFTFTGSDFQDPVASLRYECRLDGATSWSSCTSPKSFTSLTNGSHTVQVRAVDTKGLVDPTPASYTWLVDTVAPVVPVPSNQVIVDGAASGANYTFNVVPTDIGGSGIATSSCSRGSGLFALGVTTVTCTATDRAGNATTKSFTVTVGAMLGAGRSFVIGDLSDNVGTTGYYWGSQWWKAEHNKLSKEPKPPSFKGYANRINATTWFTDPGNSSVPPDAVPSYLTVIVASDVNKSGSTISGDIVAYAIIKTEPGYGPAPGHVGDGQIIAVVPR
jgi:hypothetical protein